MKTHIIILACLVLFSASTCKSTADNKKCFKAKLEIKGICMNYTIRLLEGDPAALKLARTWTDENTGKKYANVFALSNPCTFPDMKEGAEFYFILDQDPASDCATCRAYYPVPGEKLAIKVLPACN